VRGRRSPKHRGWSDADRTSSHVTSTPPGGLNPAGDIVADSGEVGPRRPLDETAAHSMIARSVSCVFIGDAPPDRVLVLFE
jgi:hypothetical protein